MLHGLKLKQKILLWNYIVKKKLCSAFLVVEYGEREEEAGRGRGGGGGGGTSLPAAPFRPTPEALSLPPGGGTSLPPDAGGALAGAGAGAWAGGGEGACMGRGEDQNRCRFGRARRPDESRNACWTPAPVCVQYVCIRAHEFKSRAQYLAQVAPGMMHPKLNV